MPSIGAAKQALLLAQIMHTAAYSALNVARPLGLCSCRRYARYSCRRCDHASRKN